MLLFLFLCRAVAPHNDDQLLGQVAHKHFLQLKAVNRLGQVVRKALCKEGFARTGHGVRGKHDARRPGASVVGQLLHCVEGFHAVHLRHAVVDENNVVALVLHKLQRLHAAQCRVHVNLGTLEQPFHHSQVHLGVVDHKDMGIRRAEGFRVGLVVLQVLAVAFVEVADFLPPDHALLDGKRKIRTLAVLAGNVQVGLHLVQQHGNDVQAKAGALDGAVALFVHTLKGLEELGQVFRLYADSRVLDLNLKVHRGVVNAVVADVQRNRAVLRVLDGVVQDVQHALLYANFVAKKQVRHLFVHVDIQLQLLCPRFLGDHVHDVADGGTQLIFFRHDVDFARFNLGEIQNVVDERQQRAAR